jgi:hypothetical protein
MTMPQPIPFFPATSDFPSGADTPRDLLERCLARFEDFEPAVGAFVCHDIGAAHCRGPCHRAVACREVAVANRRYASRDQGHHRDH